MADPTAAAAHHDRDPGPSEDVAASAVRRLDFPPGLARLSGLPTLHELMHRHVSVRGASVAIRDPRGEITFGQLAAQGDAIAGALAGAGGRRGDPVLVLMHPGADVVASILGAAGAGRPAMLLDPLAPVDALRSVAPDLNNPVVLVDAAHVVHAEHLTAGDVIRVDALSETYTAAPSAGGLDEVAMVSWTSGSSGRPKGVMHTQRTVLSNGMRVSRSFSLSPSDRVLALAPLHFVGGSTPVFVALWAGASLDVCTMASQGPDAVARTIVDRGITALQMSPSHARALHEAAPTGGFPSLRLALVGGERLTVEQGRMLCATFPNARVVYRYSTSETFWVAGAELDRSKLEAAPAGVLPQGWTVPWLDVALVDRSPGDAGVETGELQVIGDALSVGYFDDAALTAERFPEHEGHRGFRTRDLFRRYPDGLLHHAGRLDRTLKVKGIRVDLDAVERALRALPPVDDAVVGAVPLRGGSRLVARVTVVGGGDAVTGASLRRDLTAVLLRHSSHP